MCNTDKAEDRSSEILKWLKDFPGDAICALQIWYEGLGSMGTPAPAEIAAIEGILAGVDGWRLAGNVRYEKMGLQTSFKRTKPKDAGKAGHIMVQHMFKLNSLQKAPDGRVFKIVLSEVYNLRCFEVKDGNLVGGMIKIHPASEFAKSLVEV
jgi:hypothetical protein